MSRITVECVYVQLSEIILENDITGLTDRNYQGGKQQVQLDTKLLIFLWYMSNKVTYRQLENLFGFCKNFCCDVIHMIAKTFSQYLVRKTIRWPNHHERIEISWTIEQTKRFPNVIGMIDGTHIPVQKPRDGGLHFYNRKDFHSIILQGNLLKKRNDLTT